jgi:Permuted papain-like amidase enzyme, YaeF/YiiX, C92 family
MNLRKWLLGGPGLVDAKDYQSFAPYLEDDARSLETLCVDIDKLEKRFDSATETIKAAERGYFTPDEDDTARQMLLSYRNYRLAVYAAVWRYVHYPRETDLVTQLKGFTLGYAAALTLFSKSLKLIQRLDPNALVRAKLNEPDERFGLDGGFWDEVVETYCSLRFLALFAIGDQFWRKNRRAFRRLGIETDPAYAAFVERIRVLRSQCWTQFWPTVRQRMRYERRHKVKLLFAPVRATGWGAQTLLGHAMARMRTTLDYKPAVNGKAIDYLAKRLRTGDVLFTRTEHKVTTALLPGFFAHVAIYLGKADDLKRLGLHRVAAVQKAWSVLEKTSEYGYVLEARHAGVIVQPLEKCLECDHVMALRPTQLPGSAKHLVSSAFEHYGKPYDFDFDFGRTSHVVCTELVYRPMHKQGPYSFNLVKRMGRHTLTVDDIARQYLQDISVSPSSWQALAFLTQWSDGQALPVAVDAIPGVVDGLVNEPLIAGASRQLWPFLEAQLEAEAKRSQAVRVVNETILKGETV